VETVRLLGVAGVDSVTKQNLRALGFGADSAREIIDKAPPRVAAQAWGADEEEKEEEE
jgi:hypothetical protein